MSNFRGLNNLEVENSRAEFGSNVITPPKRESWLKMLLGKFNDPLIKILLVATAISIVVNILDKKTSPLESVGIIVAILIATIISFLNEYRAQKEFDILYAYKDKEKVKVIREGNVIQLPIVDIVVGDIVIVESGDEVPADGKILKATDLKVNESALNGESDPALKSEVIVDSYTCAFSPNEIFRGSLVMEGNGVFEVFAVGDKTLYGETARDASINVNVQSPLQRELSKLGKMIGYIGITLSTLVLLVLLSNALFIVNGTSEGFISGNTTHNIYLIIQFLMIAITLIVMAVPEGLPMSVTLSMAYSMRSMAKENTLVRKIDSPETMGAVSVICADKTGTITYNKMKVQYLAASEREEDIRMLASDISINSTAHLEYAQGGESIIGSQTEGALLSYFNSKNYDYKVVRKEAVIIQRVPFSSEKKCMSTHYKLGDIERIAIKGGPEIILNMCKSSSLTPDFDPNKILSEIESYQRRGNRCIAFASRTLSDNDFTYNGFAAIQDSVREEVPVAIEKCKKAGIAVKILTGDTLFTAVEIAKQAGLWNSEDSESINAITGENFALLSEEEAKKRIPKIKIIARARPQDKLKLVKILQQMGEIVAVTGDGVNDSPALNHANVSLAMGSGSSIAKERSDIILLDDSFNSLVNAVKWGRTVYSNIQRFILFQLTVNAAALLIALIGPFVGVALPLTVTQILWVNLIMDTLAAIALATGPANDAVMNLPPRKVGSIVSKKMLVQIAYFSSISLVCSIVFLVIEKRLDPSIGIANPKYLSIFFTGFVLLQLWNLFNVKLFSTSESIGKSLFSNRAFLLIVLFIFVLQIILVEFGGNVMRTTHLEVTTWFTIIITTAILILGGGKLFRLFSK